MTYSLSNAYDNATNSLRVQEIAKDTPVEEELIDTTNVAAATNYYPSSTGKVLDRYRNVSIQGVISGGVTFTVEAKIDDSTDWLDITKSGYRLGVDVANSVGLASIVDEAFIMDFGDLNVNAIRIKSVTADATNGVQYHWKLSV